MLKIWLLSDLHCEIPSNRPFTASPPDADILAAVGDLYESDITKAVSLVNSLRGTLPAIFVAGNHEYWGSNFKEVAEAGRAEAAKRGVTFLNNDVTTIAGVRIAGATLWSSMDPTDSITPDLTAIMTEAPAGIAGSPSDIFEEPIYVEGPNIMDRHAKNADIQRRHEAALTFLRASNADAVLTHHPPTLRALSALPNASLWVHGHIHTSVDCRHGDTRIVCNPRGMFVPNRHFDDRLVVAVSRR